MRGRWRLGWAAGVALLLGDLAVGLFVDVVIARTIALVGLVVVLPLLGARRVSRRGWELALGVGALAMPASLLAPWFFVDCDSGCLDGRSGGVTTAVATEARLWLVIVLGVSTAIVARMALKSERRERTHAWLAAGLGFAGALVLLSIAIGPPANQSGAPVIGHRFGWVLGIAVAIFTAAASAQVVRAPADTKVLARRSPAA